MRSVNCKGQTRSSIVAGLVLTCALAIGCAAHDDTPTTIVTTPAQATPAPVIVQEIEPPIPLPPIVAPALPPLAPTRPLANLEVLWHPPDPELELPPPATIWAVGRTPIPMPNADATKLGLSGTPVNLSVLEDEVESWAMEFAGPLLLARTTAEFTALERSTNSIAWNTQDEPSARSFEVFVTPRVLVAQLYTHELDRVRAWALDSGRFMWERGGLDDPDLGRIKKLWTDGVRGYLQSEAGLVVFDPNTGTTLWTVGLADSNCGVATGNDFVILEDPDGHRVLDAASGTETEPFPRQLKASCTWEAYSYHGGTAPAVIADGRLYAFDSQAHQPRPLRAFDILTRAELWSAEGFDDDQLAVDHDAVYLGRDEELLLVLDAATGQAVTEVSIGAPFHVRLEPVGGDAGPLVVVDEGDSYRWILGRGDAPTPPESYTITGTLLPIEGTPRRRVSGVYVHVGEQLVKTDKRGRFKARGQARGALLVQRSPHWETYEDEEEYTEEWTQVVVDPRRVFLDGSGTYDLGKLEAYEISME